MLHYLFPEWFAVIIIYPKEYIFGITSRFLNKQSHCVIGSSNYICGRRRPIVGFKELSLKKAPIN